MIVVLSLIKLLLSDFVLVLIVRHPVSTLQHHVILALPVLIERQGPSTWSNVQIDRIPSRLTFLVAGVVVVVC